MIWWLVVGLLFGAFLVLIAKAADATPSDMVIIVVFTTYPFFMAAHIVTGAVA